MDREFIFNMYNYEWFTGVPGGSTTTSGGLIIPTETAFNNWLDVFSYCGFTTIATSEYILLDSGGHWNLWGDRPLTSNPNDTIISRLRDAGFKIMLRLWPCIHKTALTNVASQYGQSCIGLNRDPISNNVWALNVYRNSSLRLIKDFAAAIKNAGVYDMVDFVAVGWGDSGEVDDIQQFAGIPVRYRTERANSKSITRSGTAPSRNTPNAEREVRIPEAHEAIGEFFNAVVSTLGKTKPIGCNRGSSWHVMESRKNLPFFPTETYVQANDGNQLSDAACKGAPTSPFYGSTETYVQRESVAFSCDLLRGAGADIAIIEPDILGFTTMNPPNSYTNTEGHKAEIAVRSEIAFKHNVGVVYTHWGYERTVEWQDTFVTIKGPDVGDNPRKDAPLTPAATLNYTTTSDYTYIRDVVLDWRAAGGCTGASVPIVLI